MPDAKRPSSQGISALLKKAGFTRSEASSTAVKGWRNRTRGFAVTGWRDCDYVLVRHESGAFRVTDADREAMAEMLGEYTEVIRAAGYSVTVGREDQPYLGIEVRPATEADR